MDTPEKGMDKAREFVRLLEIFIKVIEANKGLEAAEDNRILDAEGLALKFFGHASSALWLYRATALPDLGVSFVDASSINVLGRAALETFLVFHYVFVNPESAEEKDFRYLSWFLAGLLDRQRYPVQSPEGRALLAFEASLISPLKQKLAENPCFFKLSNKRKRKVVEKGEWRLASWRDIALSAGLSSVHADGFYNYLCGYAHAGNISVLQLRGARDLKAQRELSDATIGMIMIAMANMINSYCELFRLSQMALIGDTEARNLIYVWISVGREVGKTSSGDPLLND
jgi:hypothetical protein